MDQEFAKDVNVDTVPIEYLFSVITLDSIVDLSLPSSFKEAIWAVELFVSFY